MEPVLMAVQRASAGDSPVEILDRVLDKGIVIDASVRVALIGIEVLGVDARVVVASFETYLRHADAIAATGLAAPTRTAAENAGAAHTFAPAQPLTDPSLPHALPVPPDA
jgi:gas vesicle structural protein